MITLRKLVSDIRLIASSGPTSQDFRISDRQIAHWIGECRAILISQAMSKREDAQDVWQQTIPKIELQLVDKSRASDLTTDCNILKSLLPIPGTIDGTENYFSITGIDDTQITPAHMFNAKYKKFNKFTSKKSNWYIKDSYLFIENTTADGNMLKYVSGTGIFEDPKELNAFKTAIGEILWDWDSEYTVTAKLANAITDIIIKTKVLPLVQSIADPQNNAKDNSERELKQ
mgnify:CR=1 FL=1